MTTGMLVESPVRGNSHAGFGGRPAETERPKDRHRAAGRPYWHCRATSERGRRGMILDDPAALITVVERVPNPSLPDRSAR